MQSVHENLAAGNAHCPDVGPLPLARTRAISWGIVVALGLLQAWSHRLYVSPDGVSYLDVAEYYAAGSWGAAINAYWSPLYSWLLALCLYVFRYSRQWESSVLHVINFAGYLGAYRSFEFFLNELIRTVQEQLHLGTGLASLSEFSWRMLGMGLFLYSTLRVALVGLSTPDIFVVLCVCLAAGLLLRIRSGCQAWKIYVGLGVTLGLGSLAKSAMFPVSFVFMSVAAVLSIRQRSRRLAFLVAPVCFALVVAPWVTALSRAKGHFTFGETGRLAYAQLAGPGQPVIAWAGPTQNTGSLAHPPRRLSDGPPVIEFATPVPGTYPLWYDNSYWLEGLQVHFSLHDQLRVLRESCNSFLEILTAQREYVALLSLLFLLSRAGVAYFRMLLRLWAVWLPAVTAMGMYSLVLVEPRYIAGFLLIFWLSLFAAIQLPAGETLQRAVQCAVAAVVLATSVQLLRGAASDVSSIFSPAPNEERDVARGLRTLGLAEGQSIASIGRFGDSFNWARLAGLHIVSIVPPQDVNQYWFGGGSTRAKVDSLFAQSGAVAIVSDTVPAGISVPGWERVGKSSYFVFLLRPESPGHGAS